MTAMAGSFATLPVDEQQTAASGLFSVAGSVLGTLATVSDSPDSVKILSLTDAKFVHSLQ